MGSRYQKQYMGSRVLVSVGIQQQQGSIGSRYQGQQGWQTVAQWQYIRRRVVRQYGSRWGSRDSCIVVVHQKKGSGTVWAVDGAVWTIVQQQYIRRSGTVWAVDEAVGTVAQQQYIRRRVVGLYGSRWGSRDSCIVVVHQKGSGTVWQQMGQQGQLHSSSTLEGQWDSVVSRWGSRDSCIVVVHQQKGSGTVWVVDAAVGTVAQQQYIRRRVVGLYGSRLDSRDSCIVVVHQKGSGTVWAVDTIIGYLDCTYGEHGELAL